MVSKDDRTKSAPVEHSIVPDVWGIIFFAFAFIILFSLISYSPHDTQPRLGGEQQVQNWIGPGGALIADVLLTVLGVMAFALPLVFLAWSIACFWRRRFIRSYLQTSGVVLAWLGLSILLTEIAEGLKIEMSFPLGGVLGHLLDGLVLGYVSTLGTVIVSIASVLLGLVMATRKPVAPVVSTGLGALPKVSMAQVGSPFKKLWALCSFKSVPAGEIPLPPFPKGENKTPVVAPTREIPPSPLPKGENSAPVPAQIHHPHPVKPKPVIAASDVQIIERDVSEGKRAVELAEKEGKRKAMTFELPPLNLLDYDAPQPIPIDERVMRAQAERLEKTFAQFSIEGHVREIRPGPVVTLFEFVPAPGIKLSRIAALADDIAMAMTAVHVRVVAPLPGKGAVGIEIPNEIRETVYLKEIVAHPNYRQQTHKLCMALGKTVEGKPYYLNLADMPHVLIAGTTGSGKSVSVNAMICSLLYRATPEEVRFLMIDPKMLELGLYEGIPHLLLPPIIDSQKAAAALRWTVKEMDRRYQAMNELGVRDIYGYNEKVEQINKEQGHHVKMPYIVVVVDEYADLIATAGKDVEACVMRLAQKARAAGLHVMLATQRPSVDVITGVIKANFPVRMSFRLASAHDSKTIINRSGAEKLLGKGDMLMIPPGTSDLVRVHGAFISEKELSRVVEFWKKQAEPSYDMSIMEPTPEEKANGGILEDASSSDERYNEATEIVRRTKRCSTSWLQRQMGIGYNRAARLVEQMEKEGGVGPIQNAKGDRVIFGEEEPH